MIGVNATKKGNTKWCPIGFKLAHTERFAVCYRRKDPETFSDYYKDCTKNNFSLELYSQLPIDKSKPVWSEYKNAYPGGPFLDNRFTEHLQYELDPMNNVTYQQESLESEEHLCIVIDPVQSYMAVRCDEKHHRYCFVEPLTLDDVDDGKNNCKDLKDALSFSSPIPACLVLVFDVVIDDTRKVEEKCEQKEGLSVLSKGWLYANHPRLKHRNYIIKHSEVPSDTSPQFDYLFSMNLEVNKSNDFDVICERIFSSRGSGLNIYNHDTQLAVYSTVRSLNLSDIYCFNDSLSTFPSYMVLSSSNILKLGEYEDGYFWCIHRDPITYELEESNKILYIRNEHSLLHVYAVKFRSRIAYNNGDNNLLRRHQVWAQDLMEYLRDVNKRVNVNVELDLFEEKHAKYVNKLYENGNYTGLRYMKMKRRYLDGKTFLYHVELHPDIKVAVSRSTRSVEVLRMRPVYYCEEIETADGEKVPRKPMNDVTTVGCETYRCIGDFNEGVQWNATTREGCVRYTTQRKPADRFQQVIDDLDRLLNDTVSMDNITTVLVQANKLLEVNENLEYPGRFLPLLDQVGSAVNLNGSHTAKVVSTNIALLVGDADPDRPIWGFRIAARDTDRFTNDSFEIMTQVPDPSALNSKINEVMVMLPAKVATSAIRISFMAFRDERLFRRSSADSNIVTVNSCVVAVTIQNLTKLQHGEVIEINFSPIRTNATRNERLTCAYWHFNEDDGKSGYWSQDGCTFIHAMHPGMLDLCRCDHLTHFALILIPRTVFSETNETALRIISIVGCCLSILGLIMVGVTAAVFRVWRKQFCNKIWLQLCISIFSMSICFLIIVYAKFYHYSTGCMLVGIALHYSVLCSLCWMLIAAVISYRKLVLVFSRDFSRKLLKACVFSYGTPCVVIGMLLSVTPRSYERHFEEKTPSSSFCYPFGLSLWLTVYAPIAAILLVNWVLFALIVRSTFSSTKVERHGDSNNSLRCASVSCFLAFLFGLTWVSGLFAYNIAAAYLFTVTGSFQGLILSMFLILGNVQTRNMWINKFKSPRKISLALSTSTNKITLTNSQNHIGQRKINK